LEDSIVSKYSDTTLSPADEQREAALVQEAEQFYQDRTSARLDRRKLITNLSLAAGAAGVLGLAGCSQDGAVPVSVPSSNLQPTVLDILNFALNLEYFEASFYSYIVTGSGLSAADMGTGAGTVTGGAKVTFTNSYVQNIAENLMQEEVEHVELLRATISSAPFNGTPVSMPNLNLAPLPALAVTNDATFLAVARAIEGVGVSAYAGGAQYLVSSIPALTYAAQILDTEAQHEGALRQACIYYPGITGTSPITSPAVDALDMPPTLAQLFNTSNTTGLAPVRTISQVLGIVYGGPNASVTTPTPGITKGGFFPNGFNGNIYST
jgi:hypothetical protein